MKRSHSQIDINKSSHDLDEDEDKLFAFIPPLHIQRKRKVLDNVMDFIDESFSVTPNRPDKVKIIDVGCERGAFFQFLQFELIGNKHKFDTDYIGIDISDFTLRNETISNLSKFTFGNSNNIRNGSVSVKLLHENVLNPSFYLDRADILIMIEVIEHIKINDVNENLPRSIFEEICPKMVIITTPNADFNEIFGLKSRLQFRHWDHKFEWTRNEFKCWCDNVVKHYPEYQYRTDDIGISDQYPLHGGGSQMAIFKRREPQPISMNVKLSTSSTIVYEKENFFSALSEYEVIKKFLSFKMSIWAIEKHVAGNRVVTETENLDIEEENLGSLEYDEELSCEIFKVPVNVVRNIVEQEFPDSTVDIINMLKSCSDYSIYFKLSDDGTYIYYSSEDHEEIDDEEEYMKTYSKLYEK